MNRRTDRRTTCNLNTALCTKVHRAVMSRAAATWLSRRGWDWPIVQPPRCYSWQKTSEVTSDWNSQQLVPVAEYCAADVRHCGVSMGWLLGRPYWYGVPRRKTDYFKYEGPGPEKVYYSSTSTTSLQEGAIGTTAEQSLRYQSLSQGAVLRSRDRPRWTLPRGITDRRAQSSWSMVDSHENLW